MGDIQKKNHIDNNQGKESVYKEKLHTEVADMYIFLMVIVFPLFISKGYGGLFSGKWNLFFLCSLLFICVSAFTWIVGWWKNKNKIAFLNAWSKLDYVVLIYLICVCISYMGAFDRSAAFWGVATWNMGFVAQILFVGVYFFLSRGYEKNNYMELAAGGVYVIICGILLLQRFGLDVFGWYENYGMEIRKDFVTTLGQVTWGSVYISVMLTICMGLYAKEEERPKRILIGSLLCIGWATIVVQNCDSAIVALVLAMAVFFYYACKGKKAMERFLEVILIAVVAIFTMGVLFRFLGKYMVPIDGIYLKLAKSPLILVVFVVALGIWLLVKKEIIEIGDGKSTFILRGIFFVITGVCAILLVVLFVLHANGYFPNSPVANYFHFSPWWGNSRGFIWGVGQSVFADFEWYRKLFGCGPDGFSPYAYMLMGNEINVFWNNQLLPNVHNEWFGAYINYGIIGGTAYLGIFLVAFIRFFKKGIENAICFAAALGVIAYIGHNILCYQQVIGTSLIFVVLGIGEGISRKNKPKQ